VTGEATGPPTVVTTRRTTMADFNFWTFSISVAEHGDRDRLVATPMHPAMIISFAHEYIHYLQSVSSLLGFNILEQIIRVGIDGARKLTGHDKPAHGLSLDAMLGALDPHAGAQDPDIAGKCQALIDELACYMNTSEYPYDGPGQPWDVVRGSVTHGTYQNGEVYGYLTDRRTFRPFFPRLLTEGIARQADRWFAVNEGMDRHAWGDDLVETEVYRGVRNILLRPAYGKCVHRGNIDEFVVILCTIALLAPHPDWAVMKMLETIAREPYWMPIAAWDQVLRKAMIVSGELDVAYFNEVMDRVLHGPSQAIARSEFLPVYDLLKVIHSASVAAIQGSFVLFDRSLNWDGLWQTVLRYQLPPVHVSDGTVFAFNGAACNEPLHRLIYQIHAKVFPKQE
jgi:hypothetical protein